MGTTRGSAGRRLSTAAASASIGAAIALAGCSSNNSGTSGGNGSSSGSGSSNQNSSATVPASANASSQAAAAGMLIVASDLPTGWTSTGQVTKGMSHDLQSSSGKGASLSKLSSCIGTSVPLDQNVPEADGPTFNDSSGNQSVSETIQVYGNATSASNNTKVVSDPKTPGCFVSVLGPSLAQSMSGGSTGGSVGKITASLRPFPSLGDKSTDLAIAAPFSESGVQLKVYVDEVVIAKGANQIQLTFTNVGQEFPSDVMQRVARAAAAKAM